MIPAKALVTIAVVGAAIGAALLLERPADAPGEVKAEQLLTADLVGEPDKEVNIQVYTFPPGASVPWHIHPDAHEFDYQLEGALTLQKEGEGAEILKRGEAVYVAPNVVHRGLNVSRTQAAKIMVVRVKPKDRPLTTEVEP
ncbi:MAG: cupin domain-containing protein [Methyloceanibacter sp.]|jgi:quercetin dioxygenase-like cupin family protein|nr:MAG: cupin domain-containing protein [Hyphomicrobiales bacterium]